MSLTAGDLITDVATTLQDQAKVTWTDPDLLAALNEALQALVGFRPDANVGGQIATLSAGGVHTLPSGATRLMALLYNVDANNNPTSAIRGPVPLERIMGSEPTWIASSTATAVSDFAYSPVDPRIFYVYPGVKAGTKVYARLALAPAQLAQDTAPIGVDDIYSPALKEWMLYVAFRRDSEDTPNYARAMEHQKAFFSLLGIKAKGDASVIPQRVHPQGVPGQ